MGLSPPLVVENIAALDFVNYLLDHHSAPSCLIVCSPKAVFLEQLQADASIRATPVGEQDDDTGNERPDENGVPPDSSWLVPTLRLLSTSRTIKVAFCPDITHLRAYLATYALRVCPSPNRHQGPDDDLRVLAILNLIELHRPTSAFSAQGLNRTIALAVEASYHLASRLLIAECLPTSATEDMPILLDEAQTGHATPESPWDQEISILNVTTKSFGAGERGWVGRTVKLRAIAQRWCEFKMLDELGECAS